MTDNKSNHEGQVSDEELRWWNRALEYSSARRSLTPRETALQKLITEVRELRAQLKAARDQLGLKPDADVAEDISERMGELYDAQVENEELQLDIEELQGQVAELQDKNSKLHRRCQRAESAANLKIEEIKRKGGSFGRALAEWGYMQESEKNKELRAKVEELQKESAQFQRMNDEAQDGFNRLKKENAELLENLDLQLKGNDAMADRIEELEKGNERLKALEMDTERYWHGKADAYREALEKYADADNWAALHWTSDNRRPLGYKVAWNRLEYDHEDGWTVAERALKKGGGDDSN